MTYPQQPPPIWPQYPVAPPKKSTKTGLIVGLAAAGLLVTGGAIAVTVAIVGGGSTPAVDPDPFSAQAGDCLSADEDAGSNGEFSGSAVRVHCSDSAANYTVIAQLASGSGSDCNSVHGYEYGNPVVYAFKTAQPRELCVMPKD
ncbi:hypothetical protein [Amycolatopsis sp. cmx-11-32]|uniref:LppU/SCO3897 family protein n=1 Tax=Amycolatopsis sp. cmx-11-32 TaxID=2785796 RepID=UPI0039E50A98